MDSKSYGDEGGQFYDYMDEDDMYADYEHSDGWTVENSEALSLSTIYDNCIHPVITGSFSNLLGPLIIANLAARFISSVISNRIILNIVTLFIAVSLIVFHFRDASILWILLLSVALFASMAITFTHRYPRRKRISVAWSLSLIVLGALEAYLFLDDSFIKLRAPFMILTMKFISACDFPGPNDKDHDMSTKEPILAQLFSNIVYLMHPSSCVLGYWHPKYKIASGPQNFITNLRQSVKPFLMSIGFLLGSSCLIQLIMYDLIYTNISNWLYLLFPIAFMRILDKFWQAYFTALQFRTSHYFICLMSESMFRLWDHQTSVAKPSLIEFPRSLVDVVVAWNVPLHHWLKKYVFEPSERNFGGGLAVFITYIVSSFLHGLNFQIWSVLLSLGFLTWLEYQLRKKLATAFSACVLAKKCRLSGEGEPICSRGHESSESTTTAKVINSFFTILAIIHLAFLGSAFDGREKPSYENVIEVWSNLGFYSFYIWIVTFIFYKLL